MGVNCDSGVLFWKDHEPSAAERYTLSHLHPFHQRIELAETGKNPSRVVDLHVAFGLHTFTRAFERSDGRHEFYGDNREARTFCPVRYRRSFELTGLPSTPPQPSLIVIAGTYLSSSRAYVPAAIGNGAERILAEQRRT
jgi:hypothetical protein